MSTLECAGRAAVRRAQRQLYSQRQKLSDFSWLYNQGRTLGVIGAWADVGAYPRLLMHPHRTESEAAQTALRERGYCLDTNLLHLTGGVSDVALCVRAIKNTACATSRPERLRSDCAHALVLAIQRLHNRSGITPFPGWFIRGCDGLAQTYVMMHKDGTGQRVCGAVILHTVTWPQGYGCMVAGVCIESALRQRGVASTLLAYALHDYLGAHRVFRVDAIVASGTKGMMAVGKRCGLKINVEQPVFFAHHQQGDDGAFLPITKR